MKKAFFILAIIAFSFQSTHAQWWSGSKEIEGNGNMVTKTRTVSNYDQVALLGSMDVELVAGKEGKIKVEAEENLQEYILTETEGDLLKISVKKGYNLDPSNNMPIRITVPFETLDGVYLTGSGDIFTSDEIKSENFEVKMTGSGDIRLVLAAKNTSAGITGSGDISLRGTTQDFDCKVTGSGDISAFDFKAKRVDATVTGSGDIQVYASEEIKAVVPGSGDIEYKGNPKKEDFRTMGSGSVTKK
ncbi:head GIN domain-containing protein [Salinimicrobium catena]|uniref:head GIN domain-containing protein n=1 Tax=Salinimicrobium catena TaxID=390640 RepID=UPI002FE4B28E